MDENDLKMMFWGEGFSSEQFEKLKEKIRELGDLISEATYEAIANLKRLWDAINTQLFDDIELPEYFERDPIEKTPYLFKSKMRLYDKRPHKQHHVRNNCRKEWKKGGALYG